MVTVGDQSSTNDVMIQSLLYSISKSPSIASENEAATSIPSNTTASIASSVIPSSTMASNEGAIPHTSSSTSLLYSNSQSITVQAPYGNSLDQLDPLG